MYDRGPEWGRPAELPALRLHRHHPRAGRLVVVCGLLASLALGGCVAQVALGVSTILGLVTVGQRYDDRQTQQEQNAEIKALREELARTRKALEGPTR